ncbi:hypothetical protein KY327_02550, partial [Candidatus Woesearchaeota archaeon]|nr:hypothetical protein [Candidatus Woesearchaeota archaeon]
MNTMRTNKKGLVISTLIKIIIALAVLALFASIFFVGSGALYNRIKTIFPNPNEYVHRDTYEDPKYDARPLQDNAETVFDEVHKGFRELANDTAQRCFYYLPTGLPYSDLFGDYKIAIKPVQGGVSLQLFQDVNDHV